jgi:hypothetical protein
MYSLSILCPLITINFIIIQVLDQYFNKVQDKFFALTVAADSKDLTVNETRELMFYYTMLRLVDHSALNHREYMKLYNNCISKTHSLEATNLNNTYQPSVEVQCFIDLFVLSVIFIYLSLTILL